MNAKEETSTISELKLERFLLGELDPEEANRIQRELGRDEVLQQRVERLKRSNQEILDRYPVRRMAASIRERLDRPATAKSSKKAGRLSLWPVPALSAAAAAIVIFLVLSPPGGWFTGGPAPETRLKGLEPQILLFRKTESGSERLENGASAKEHDLILIQYLAAGKAYGAIFSVDGGGTLTRHAPLEGPKSLQLQQEGAVSLDFSYELDDAPRWEKFYFVTSDSLFDLETVFEATRDSTGRASADSLYLPHFIQQTSVTLEKEASHE